MVGRHLWKARYTVLSVLVLANLVASIDKIAMSVAIPYIAADLHFSPVAMGAVMSAFFLSYSIAQIPGGVLADKLGEVQMIAIFAFQAARGQVSGVRSMAVTSPHLIKGATHLFSQATQLLGLESDQTLAKLNPISQSCLLSEAIRGCAGQGAIHFLLSIHSTKQRVEQGNGQACHTARRRSSLRDFQRPCRP